MKLRNLLLYITALTLTAVNSSCKDDDKEDTPDPRLRRVIISQIGNNVEFVVNDAEGIIFNYDSLAYGTRVDSLYPNLYSYSPNELKVQYSYDGSEYLEYRNTVAIDLSKPVKIITTNTKDNSKKEYTLEVRVHKYDIDAFEWTIAGEITAISETIISHQSLMYDDKMWQFMQTEKGCSVISSVDGKKWTSSKIDVPETLLLSTLCNIEDSLFVQGESGTFYAANFDNLKFNKFDAITSGQLLYTLNNQFWVFDEGQIKSYNKNGEIKVSQLIPDKFNVDTVRSFTAPSGYTTLGYLYAKKGENAEIWAADRYGNIECLTSASENLPYMDKTIAFTFGSTLGVLGGITTDGAFSTECYTSNNGGLSWSLDTHKDLSSTVGALADAGIFQTGDKGEFLLIGGQTEKGQSNKIWALRLKKILLEEEFLNKIK